jgi:TolA-binding protein
MILSQAITTDLIDRLPIAGGAVVLLAIIGAVTKLWLGSESRHRAELERIGAAHVAEINRMGAAHVAEVKTLGQRIDGLRAEVAEVREELEKERKIRWRAQDVAAQRVRGRQQEHQGERGEYGSE